MASAGGRAGPAATAHGLGLLTYSPLAQGVLTGKYRPGAVPDDSRAARSGPDASIFRHFSDGLLDAVQQVDEVVGQAGLRLPEFAVAWVLNQPAVAAVILGASGPEQIQQNVRAAELRLDPDLVSAVDSVLAAWVEDDPGKTGRGWSVRPDWRGVRDAEACDEDRRRPDQTRAGAGA